MSKSRNRAPVERFQFPGVQKHWYDQSLTMAMGCQGCVHSGICGGLQIEAAVFDCLTYCRCTDPTTCDNVCQRNAGHMIARLHEVKGLELDNVPSASPTPSPVLPLAAPLIYHNGSRVGRLDAGTVVLSLYEMFKGGAIRFSSRQQLLDHFNLTENTTIILSGTQEDFLIERWWGLTHREAVTRGLVDMGVAMVTTPNYSLFGDVPRLDNLFNMKRIALVWSEIQTEGMPCALHVNARTPKDFVRWTTFLLEHPEITHIAYEFGTGAGSITRIGWHVGQLVALARQVPRSLHLIVRGGINELPTLTPAFGGVTFIDTTSFLKTTKRQRLRLTESGISSDLTPTAKGQPLDELLAANIATMREHVRRSAGAQ